MVLQNGCINLHSYQEGTRVPFYPHACQHLLFIIFWTIAISSGYFDLYILDGQCVGIFSCACWPTGWMSGCLLGKTCVSSWEKKNLFNSFVFFSSKVCFSSCCFFYWAEAFQLITSHLIFAFIVHAFGILSPKKKLMSRTILRRYLSMFSSRSFAVSSLCLSI